MFDPDPSVGPVPRRDGHLALEDMGLIGDGATSALVGRDGSIEWLCVPCSDSEPLCCGLLDRARGGRFTVAADEVVEARQRYEPDTAVLITELRSPTGLVAVTDALALRPGADLSDDAPELPAYGRILLDVLYVNSALSIRADEAEEAWRVLTPVLEGWSRDLAPLPEYEAGSNGPPRHRDG